MPPMRPQRTYGAFRACLCSALAVMVAGALGGCGGGAARAPGMASDAGSRPVQLSRQDRSRGQDSVLAALDEGEVRKAVETYRINKDRAKSPFEFAGADLNGDGVPEAVVLFSGRDWCAATGCSLAILKDGPHGYRPVSRTVRVKPPVVVAPEATNGWRDLFVSTGGAGGAPLRRVRLRFSGSRYTRNAMQEAEIPPDVPQFGDVAIEKAAGDTAQTSRASRASNP